MGLNRPRAALTQHRYPLQAHHDCTLPFHGEAGCDLGVAEEGALVTPELPLDDDAQLQLITRRPREGVVVVEIGGELDMTTAPRVTAYLRAEVAGHRVPYLVLDLTAVSFMASHGVAMLVTARDEVQASDQLHLVGVADNYRVRRVLELAGLADMFTDYTDIDELLDGLDTA